MRSNLRFSLFLVALLLLSLLGYSYWVAKPELLKIRKVEEIRTINNP